MPDKSRPHVPPYTAHAARAGFGPEDPYLLVGDRLSPWLEALDDEQLRSSFLDGPRWDDLLLCMVTIFQYVEQLPDQQAADAVRARLDWKYALHLPIDYPGIAHLALRRCRRRLLREEPERRAFARLLEWLGSPHLLGARWPEGGAHQVVEVVEAVEVRTWVSEASEAMGRALEALAAHHPEWLRQVALPHWYHRYGSALTHAPEANLERAAALAGADAIRGDVAHLLAMVDAAGPPGLVGLPEIEALRDLRAGRYGEVGGPGEEAGEYYPQRPGSSPTEAKSNQTPT